MWQVCMRDNDVECECEYVVYIIASASVSANVCCTRVREGLCIDHVHRVYLDVHVYKTQLENARIFMMLTYISPTLLFTHTCIYRLGPTHKALLAVYLLEMQTC